VVPICTFGHFILQEYDAIGVECDLFPCIFKDRRPIYGTPALLVKMAARYTEAAIYEDEALLARKALNASSLNILAQK
jgi:hypothetical protein